MTLSSMVALFGAMVALAILPSPSVFAVVARSMASGFLQGSVTALGIVLGDFIFILVAIYSLSALADSLDSLFVGVKYLGGGFLIWLGIGLWRSQPGSVEVDTIQTSSWIANFLCGLLITISDPKAILFYISFLPAFLDLSQVSIRETVFILGITAIAVGGSKLAYAYLADRARSLFRNSRTRKRLNWIAGSVMIGTGIFLIVNL